MAAVLFVEDSDVLGGLLEGEEEVEADIELAEIDDAKLDVEVGVMIKGLARVDAAAGGV